MLTHRPSLNSSVSCCFNNIRIILSVNTDQCKHSDELTPKAVNKEDKLHWKSMERSKYNTAISFKRCIADHLIIRCDQSRGCARINSLTSDQLVSLQTLSEALFPNLPPQSCFQETRTNVSASRRVNMLSKDHETVIFGSIKHSVGGGVGVTHYK